MVTVIYGCFGLWKCGKDEPFPHFCKPFSQVVVVLAVTVKREKRVGTRHFRRNSQESLLNNLYGRRLFTRPKPKLICGSFYLFCFR